MSAVRTIKISITTKYTGLLIFLGLFCVLNAAAQPDRPEPPHYTITEDGRVALDCGDCGSAAADLTVSGDHLYFSADNGLFGRELWRMDAEERIRVLPVSRNGMGDSDPIMLTPFRGGLAVVAPLLAPLGDLVTPPTLFYFAPGDPHPRPITRSPLSQATLRTLVSGDWLYFDQDMPDTGRELWVTDGTSENTRLVADLAPGAASALGNGLFGAPLPGGRIVFYARTANGQGHSEYILQEAAPPHFDTRPVLIDGRRAYMTAPPITDTTLGDGVLLNAGCHESGEQLLYIPGDGSAPRFLLPAERGVTGVWEVKGLGNRAFFSGITPTHGAELWVTDGTPDGTRMLKDIWPGEAGGSPHKLLVSGDRVYFAANDGTHGGELWTSDGTETGTRMVFDALPGAAEGAPYQLTAFQGLCFFAVENLDYGEELWRTDGTTDGTWMLRDIHPGPGDAEPYYLQVFNDRLYFAAQDGQRGEELWVTDGTTEGTRLVHDLQQPLRWVTSSNPEQLTAYKGNTYFVAEDGMHGRELWRADTDDAELVIDLAPGRADANIEHLCVYDGALSFDADTADGTRARYVSDGTAAGTRAAGPALGRKAGPALEELLPEAVRRGCLPGPLPDDAWVVRGDHLFFRGFSAAEGSEPWVWRRGDAEARNLRDHFAGPAGSHPKSFLRSGDAIYYVAEISAGMTAIFRASGENHDIARVSTQVYPAIAPHALAAVPGGVVFMTMGPVHFLFAAAIVSSQYSTPDQILPYNVAIPEHEATRAFVHTGDALFFDCYDPFFGRELWVKQDHLVRPTLVRDIFPAPVRN